MAKPRPKTDGRRTTNHPTKKAASFAIADRGIKTSRDFADMMSAMMSDVIHGLLTPSVSNAACNAGGKLLKVIEMEYKYAGTPGKRTQRSLGLARRLKLASDT